MASVKNISGVDLELAHPLVPRQVVKAGDTLHVSEDAVDEAVYAWPEATWEVKSTARKAVPEPRVENTKNDEEEN